MIAVRSSLLATALLAVSAIAAASDELARAKDLYRSAAYDEALVALDQVAKETAGAERSEANEFRLFCLIALDRKVDARTTIETMVNGDPFYQLSSEASPRVQTLFKEVRQSLLPAIVQREYTAAKAAFDKQDPGSSAQFDRVLTLMSDPLLGPSAALSDLHTVALGFRDLSKALAKKAEPAPPAAAPPVIAQTAVNSAPSLPSPASAAVSSAATAAPAGPAVYREGDAGVVGPVTIKQILPQWRIPSGAQAGVWKPEAVLEVVIDESGSVASARLREPFHPSYDGQLVKAAMEWKYEPARKDGVPVRFVKHVAVRLGGTN
jgi:TonB family protein